MSIIIQKIKSNYLLVGIIVIGAIMRFYHLDFQSVWLDEIHTLNEANPNLSFAEVYDGILKSEPHPPLYFYVIFILFKIFGYTPIVARLFSAIVGIFTIYALYKLGKELANKNVGLIAALLLAVNGFHIYHSQDARPYALLCLMTVLSFLYLIRFIKLPSRRNALLYGAFGSLMLYGHFFSLFALASQIALLGFFLAISGKQERKPFLLNSLLAGLVMAILFIPASLQLFLTAAKMKGFWIPAPTPDVYTLIFKEFFGNSEVVICLFGILITLYFIKLSKVKRENLNLESIVLNKTLFSFIILIVWIVIVIFIPLVRSHVSVPMIISRYFINILPAILIIIAIGLSEFRNRLIQISFLVTLLLFTLTDFVIVKRYYKGVHKSQFREVSTFISSNNQAKDKLVSALGWYFPYFLDTKEHKSTIIVNDLDTYVSEMANDSTLRKPFWYADGHSRPYKVTDATQKYLDANFTIENSIDLYDVWARHYVRNSGVKQSNFDLSKFQPLGEKPGEKINYNVEVFETTPDTVSISGWGYLDGEAATYSAIKMVLINNQQAIQVPVVPIRRDDVNQSDGRFDLSNSGFLAKIILAGLPSGNYKVGLFIRNSVTNKEGLVVTDKVVKK